MARPVHLAATVSRIVRHSPDVATFLLDTGDRRLRFKPGQFIHLALDEYDPAGHWPESRVFSLASAPIREGPLEITVSRQGHFTSRLLDTVAEGARVWCKGPYGDFTLDAARLDSMPLVLIAGGTGITPFCSFMEELLITCRPLPRPVYLHYGARRPELLVYRELIRRCAAEVVGFNAVLYSEEGALSEGIETGRLSIDRIVGAKSNHEDMVFYLSGPKVMIDAFHDSLAIRYGVLTDHIMIDAWE